MSNSGILTSVQWLNATTALACVLSMLTIAQAAAESSTEKDARLRRIALLEETVDDQVIVEGQYFERQISSATKTRTPLIDVPQSVTVLTEEQIDDQAFFDIADISRFTPGISIGQGEGHRDQITIRGQNTTADFFVDGLRDDVQYFRPFYNIQNVEVLRGSNALIFGRGGGGGVINRVIKKPVAGENFTTATASVDRFGAFYFDADANVAIGANAGFRLNGFYESLDNHRDFFEGERFGVNPTASTKIGEKTSLFVSYEYLDDDRRVDRGVPSFNGAPLEGFDNTFFGDPDLNRTTLQAHIAKARIDHEFSDHFWFNTTVQYADYDKLYQNLFPVGFDGANVSLDGYSDTTDRENFIVQSNFVGEFDTGFLGHTILAGFEYTDQQTENTRRDTLFADSQDDQITFLFSDPLTIPDVSFPVFNRNRDSDVDVLSFYFQDQIDIGDHIKIIGGFRYDRFDINVVDFVEVANGADDGNDGLLGRADEEISPRFGLIYKPIEAVSVYGSYSRSFLPRAGDQFLTLSLNAAALAPERFENYEVGVKWDINPTLSLTAALFRLDRENGLTIDPTDVGNNLIIGSRTDGVELQLIGDITPWWRVTSGYSYLDADERGRVVNDVLANRVLSQVPEHMFSIWNQFDVTDRLGFGAGVTYQSSQFASISNNVALDGFTRVDAAIFYELSDRFELQVNIENLFDSDFFPSAHNDNNITTAEPVNARFTVRSTF